MLLLGFEKARYAGCAFGSALLGVVAVALCTIQLVRQDAALLPVVQRGMRSRGFKGQLWGEQEQRLRHFHVELERRLAVT